MNNDDIRDEESDRINGKRESNTISSANLEGLVTLYKAMRDSGIHVSNKVVDRMESTVKMDESLTKEEKDRLCNKVKTIDERYEKLEKVKELSKKARDITRAEKYLK